MELKGIEEKRLSSEECLKLAWDLFKKYKEESVNFCNKELKKIQTLPHNVYTKKNYVYRYRNLSNIKEWLLWSKRHSL